MRRLLLAISIMFSLHLAASSTDSIKVDYSGQNKIDGSSMNNREQSSNAIDAIRGRVAGMTVERSGQNALSAVRLRGTTSLMGNNDPLIIVDGVIGDMSLLESVYPTDIESFEILKDASETAQYGSRGSSGVIKVTTLKGNEGRIRVQYNGSVSVGSVYKTLNMLTANEYRQYAKSNGIGIIDKGYDTDWQRELCRTAVSHHHHLAFTGGSNRTQYRASIGYIDDEYVVGNTGSRTLMTNMNLRQMMFEDVLKIDVGMFGSVQRERALFNSNKLFYSAACFNPTYPNEKNGSGSWDGYAAASQISNPMFFIENKIEPENAHLSSNLNLDFRILESLHLRLFGAYTYRFGEDNRHLPTEDGGTVYRSTNKQNKILGNAQIEYSNRWGVHKLDVTGLAELQSEQAAGYYVTSYQSSTADLSYDRLSQGSIRPWSGSDSYRTKANMLSFMVRAAYSLYDRYELSASIRADGSSKFSRNNRWGLFPSVSASWILKQERWLKDNDILDDLRLNIGYGYSGNQSGIDSYLTQELYEPNGVMTINGKMITTFAMLRNANKDLKWEVSRTVNAGGSMSMFNGRLISSINFYNTLITDMLYSYRVSTPPYTYSNIVANLGSMRNQGVELSVGGTIVNTKDWQLTVNANMSWQQNKLLKLDGYLGNEYLYASDYQAISKLSGAGSHGGDNDIVWQIVGQPLGAFYIPEYTGMVATGKGYEYGEGEKKILGQATPKILLGANISLRFRDWDLQVQMNGAFGHKIYNGTSLAYMNLNSLPLYNVQSDAPSKQIYDQKVTSYWLEKGDYVNIDYITLGYRVPLPKNKVVESLRIVMTMNNVATITAYSGLTPMINSSNINQTVGVDDKNSYPLYHTYTLGLSLGF